MKNREGKNFFEMSKARLPYLANVVALLSSVAALGFSEAPELHQRVEAGELPQLSERLPLAPLVISPLEKLGVYGGTWRMALVGYDFGSLLNRVLSYENIVRWDPNWTRVLPNVASSWTVNADATVYRFKLRQGMRWSDGHPYTARDIVAWVDDVARDPELTPLPPAWLALNGHLPECTAPDDFTVEFHFAAPHVLFLELLAGMRAFELTHYPAHYFRPMHRRHNPAGADELMRRTGMPWAEAFNTVYTPWSWRNAGAPTINAWCLANNYAQGFSSVRAVRNPYYWKIDTLGRQLPYLDEVTFTIVATPAEVVQRAVDGQVDYQREYLDNKLAAPAILAAEKAGKVRTIHVVQTLSNPIAICLNLTHPNPAMRAALSDKRVRIALSEAIDRPAIIRDLYGKGTGKVAKPWQVAPRAESRFLNQRLGEQYTAYAPEKSKVKLDEVGLRVGEAGGLRKLANGRPFHLEILVPGGENSEWSIILDHVKKDWLAIGVEVEWKRLTRLAHDTQIPKAQHDGSVWWGSGGNFPILEPEFFVPVSFENVNMSVPYAIPWARWFGNPSAPGAEPPPASVQKQMNLFRRMLVEPKAEARTVLMHQVLEMAANEFYVMGICEVPNRLAVRTPGFRNVPSSHFDSWIYPDPGPFNPCQFFLEPAVAAAP